MKNKLFEIINTSITVEEHNVLNISNWCMNEGDIIFLIGDNGSGKSTFIKKFFSNIKDDDYAVLSAINEDKELKVQLYGKDGVINLSGGRVDDKNMYKTYVYISQEEEFQKNDSVLRALTIQTKAAIVETNFAPSIDYIKKANEYALKFLDELYKYENKYKKAKKLGKSIDELDKIALKILNKKKASQCSGGQKKLISILASFIRAEALKVKLIVMDEPMNHLDQKNKKIINQLLNELLNNRGDGEKLSLIIVSHCLVFSFINDNDNCYQYKIQNKTLVKLDKKIYHNCLENL